MSLLKSLHSDFLMTFHRFFIWLSRDTFYIVVFAFFALSCDFISLNKVILFNFCRFSLRLFLRRPGHVHGGFRVDCRGPTESTDFVDKMQGIFNSRTDALQVSDQNVNDEIVDISRSSRLTRRAISCRGRFTKTILRPASSG